MRAAWRWMAPVWCAVAGALAGCSSVPEPTPLTEDPVVQALAERAPVRARIAVAPPALDLGDPAEHAGHYDWPVPAVQSLAVESLTTARIAESVRALPLAARGRAAGLTAAWDAGDDLLLEITITRCQARYLGTNGWYVPNLILWIEFIWPAWFVADERYTVEIEGRATLTAVATGREVWSGRIGGQYEAALDDLDRGMVLLGTLRVPGALGEQNFRAIGDVLHPHAARAWQRSLAVTTDDAFRRLTTTAAYAEATRRTLGLLIGCGTYYDPGLTNLKFPTADVKAMEAWLRRAGADDRQLQILTDERATKAAILRSIRGFLAKRARSGDRVVVHFSGYAAPDGRGGVALLPYDAKQQAPGDTGITLTELAAAVAEIPDAQVLVVLDTGLGDGAGTRWADCGLDPPDPAGVREAVRRIGDRPATSVLAACEPGEGAAEVGDQRRGLLTLSWLLAVAAARDRNSDGRISVAEAFRDVRRAVQMHALLSGRTQNPQLVADDEGGIDVPAPGEGGA